MSRLNLLLVTHTCGRTGNAGPSICPLCDMKTNTSALPRCDSTQLRSDMPRRVVTTNTIRTTSTSGTSLVLTLGAPRSNVIGSSATSSGRPFTSTNGGGFIKVLKRLLHSKHGISLTSVDCSGNTSGNFVDLLTGDVGLRPLTTCGN